MSKKPTKEQMEKIGSLFGAMGASNMIGKALELALEKGYKGIEIRFIEEEAGE